MSDAQATILNLERDYTIHKEKFEEWKKTNSKLAGNPSYNRYVEQFVTWEKGVFEQLRELRSSMVRQAAASEPQLPMVNLDTQLNDILRKVTQAEFMVAIFAMAQKDPSFLPKVFEVVHRESKGTGYYNAIMPKPVVQTPSSLYITSHLPPPLLHAPNSLYMPPSGNLSYNSNSSLPATEIMRHNKLNQVFTHPTQFSTLPEGWVIDDPIRKKNRFPSPKREYQSSTSLPFKDFSHL